MLWSSSPRSNQQSIEVCKVSLEFYLELYHECDLQVELVAQHQQIDHFGSSTPSQNGHRHWPQTTRSCSLQSHNQQLEKRNEAFLDGFHRAPLGREYSSPYGLTVLLEVQRVTEGKDFSWSESGTCFAY